MRFSIAIAATIATLIVPSADAAPPARDHPILGTWTFATPYGKCVETYRFRADGTLLITSGDEVSEIKFEVSAKPSAKKFYRLDNTIVKDNGKKDCSGQTMQVGQKSTQFIQLEHRDDPMAVCQTESLEACFGPLLRSQDQRT